MFTPGHLHLSRMQLLPSDVGFSIDIRYDIDEQCTAVHFTLEGEIKGEPLKESFSLPRDTAFNFASNIDHILRHHGVISPEFLSVSAHHEYDEMFEDIRAKLHAWHGEAIDPDHLA